MLFWLMSGRFYVVDRAPHVHELELELVAIVMLCTIGPRGARVPRGLGDPCSIVYCTTTSSRGRI